MKKKNYHLKNDVLAMVDIDSTLLAYYDRDIVNKDDFVHININGKKRKFYVIRPNVKEVEEYIRRGIGVVFWSAAGNEWAKKASDALGFSKIGAVVMSKPRFILDDKQPEEFLPRSYLSNET